MHKQQSLAITLVTVLAVSALSFHAWSSYSSAQEASNFIGRGQGMALFRSIAVALRDNEKDQTQQEKLNSVFSELQEYGLRYLAITSPKGKVIRESGNPKNRQDIGKSWAVTDNRFSMSFRRPPPRRKSSHRRRRAKPKRGKIAIEFESQANLSLQKNARWSIGLAILTSLFLFGLAGLLIWWTIRRGYEQKQLTETKRLAKLGIASATLAHEIRNPLASLKGNAQLLSEKLPKGSQELAKSERIVFEASRLEALTTNLLQFAKRDQLHCEPYNIYDLVDQVVASFDRNLVAVTTAPPLSQIQTQTLTSWYCDPSKLAIAFSNLVANAIQATIEPVNQAPDDSDKRATENTFATNTSSKETRDVTITIALRKKSLVVTITDKGPGIDPSDMPLLYEPFHTTKVQGNGLGLAITKQYIEMHKGTISAANLPQGGAQFTIVLPRLLA